MNQRLSLEEVQEVARLAALRRAVVHGRGPTADRLADALGLPPAQVESLLAEIRDRKAGLLPPDDAVTFKRLGLGAATLVVLGLVFTAFNLFSGSHPKTPAATADAASVTSIESPVGRRLDSPGGVAPTPSSTVATVPGARTQLDPSNRVLPLGQEEVKDYMNDLQNARRKADEQLTRPRQLALSPTSAH